MPRLKANDVIGAAIARHKRDVEYAGGVWFAIHLDMCEVHPTKVTLRNVNGVAAEFRWAIRQGKVVLWQIAAIRR